MQEKNPTEVLEDYIISQEWYYNRNSLYEISAEVDVGWKVPYSLYFFWQSEHHIMHITCTFGLEANKNRVDEILKLLSLISCRVLIGHFEISDTGVVIYHTTRHFC